MLVLRVKLTIFICTNSKSYPLKLINIIWTFLTMIFVIVFLFFCVAWKLTRKKLSNVSKIIICVNNLCYQLPSPQHYKSVVCLTLASHLKWTSSFIMVGHVALTKLRAFILPHKRKIQPQGSYPWTSNWVAKVKERPQMVTKALKGI